MGHFYLNLKQRMLIVVFLISSLIETTIAMAQTQSCEIVHDLPLVTHYSQAAGGVQFGATDVINTVNLNFELNLNRYLLRETDYVAKYNQTILPNQFLATHYDSTSYPNQIVINSLTDFCRQSGASVHLIQVRQMISSGAQLATLISYGQRSWQIIHSIPYKNSLFSILLPPDFAPGEKLPFLINGAYDLNFNFVNWEGPSSRAVLAKAYKQGVRAVSILWNGMGGIGSRTMNDQAYVELNDFMKLIIPLLGLDTQKAISYGGSRGGVAALNIASHSAIDSFRVAYVDAASPAADPGLIADLISPTIPHLLDANDWTLGYVGSWMNSFRYPTGSGDGRLTGLTGSQAHYSLLTGNFDPSQNEHFKLQSADRIEKLNQNKSAVFLEIGSHDFIVPFADQISLAYSFYFNLKSIEININYLSGHYLDQGPKIIRMLNALKLLASTNDVTSTLSHKSVHRNIVGMTSKIVDSVLNLDYTALPITVEVPRFIIQESPVQIIVTGTASRRVKLVFSGVEGDLKEFVTVVGEKGYVILKSTFDDWSNSIYNLSEVFDLDSNDRIVNKLNLRSTVSRLENLTMYKYQGDLRPYAQNAHSVIMTSINGGTTCEDCVFHGHSTNYGVVEVGREPFNDILQTRSATNKIHQ